MRNIILIDNLDSFSFNLVEAFERLGAAVTVLRNTADAAQVVDRAIAEQALLVLSPGPGRPDQAGCCLELVARARGKAPVLGICLGHQAIVAQAGGAIVRAAEPVHGKVSLLHHDCEGPFLGLESPLHVGRYHSLGTKGLPPRFRVHAEIDGLAMAISDPQARQFGLQFHPESLLTRSGDHILRNILDL